MSAERRRSAGGSRYSDKNESLRRNQKRSGSTGRRKGRKKNSGKQNLMLIGLIVVLVLLVCIIAGYFLSTRIRSNERKEQEAASQRILEQISVNLENLHSPYAILLDGETGTILASKRGEEKIFPASMAKIMTVYTAIEEIDHLDEVITMDYDYYQTLYDGDASRAGFEPGEEVVIRDLLYGAILPSGAECCMQLAIEAAGSEDAFVQLMNQKALNLGLTQTNFTNVTGLHNEEQFTTVHEIGTILRNALQNETFHNVFTTHYYSVQPTSVHPDGFTFWSTMFKYMEQDTVNGGEIMGGKTGFTSEAGHCLASMAEIDGKEYILVTAGWAQDTDSTLYHIEDAFTAYNQIAPDSEAQS